jgi:type VI secretion system protein VasD
MRHPPTATQMTNLTKHLGATLLALTLVGCASGGKMKEAIGMAAEAVGLKKPEAQIEVGPKKVTLRVFASENLNAGAGKSPIALVVKIYQLRDSTAFEQTAYNQFLDPVKEKAALGDDLISSREVLVLPGQNYDLMETVQPPAGFIGVVALFHTPNTSRWRMSFEAKGSEKKGISLGAHACAMTVTEGLLVSKLAGEPASLSTVNCSAQQ